MDSQFKILIIIDSHESIDSQNHNAEQNDCSPALLHDDGSVVASSVVQKTAMKAVKKLK